MSCILLTRVGMIVKKPCLLTQQMSKIILSHEILPLLKYSKMLYPVLPEKSVCMVSTDSHQDMYAGVQNEASPTYAACRDNPLPHTDLLLYIHYYYTG